MACESVRNFNGDNGADAGFKSHAHHFTDDDVIPGVSQ